MPGFRSHYIFGIESRNELKKKNTKQSLEIWNMVRRYPAVYAIGEQGPDIFFYNPPSYLHRRNIGERMHHEQTLSYIMHLIDTAGTIKHEHLHSIAVAYTAGYIGHYTLDTVCHPYIHYRACKDIDDHSNRGFYNHMLLETDLDCALLAHFLRMKPSEFRPSETIRLSHEQALFLSAFIDRAIDVTYPGSLVLTTEVSSAFRFSRYVYDAMEDPRLWKKKFARSLESLFLKHPQFSAMIANDRQMSYNDPCNLSHHLWRNPWKTELFSTESFYDLFHKAMHLYLRRLSLLEKIASSDFGSRDYFEYVRMIKKDLGNLSYDSGLPL